MSEPMQEKEEQLSDDQLAEVAGGLNDRFKDARDTVINRSTDEGELSDQQLEGVAGGLSDRFDDARDQTINKLSEPFEDSRQDILNK